MASKHGDLCIPFQQLPLLSPDPRVSPAWMTPTCNILVAPRRAAPLGWLPFPISLSSSSFTSKKRSLASLQTAFNSLLKIRRGVRSRARGVRDAASPVGSPQTEGNGAKPRSLGRNVYGLLACLLFAVQASRTLSLQALDCSGYPSRRPTCPPLFLVPSSAGGNWGILLWRYRRKPLGIARRVSYGKGLPPPHPQRTPFLNGERRAWLGVSLSSSLPSPPAKRVQDLPSSFGC